MYNSYIFEKSGLIAHYFLCWALKLAIVTSVLGKPPIIHS